MPLDIILPFRYNSSVFPGEKDIAMVSTQMKSGLLMGFGAFMVVSGAIMVIFWPTMFFAQLRRVSSMFYNLLVHHRIINYITIWTSIVGHVSSQASATTACPQPFSCSHFPPSALSRRSNELEG